MTARDTVLVHCTSPQWDLSTYENYDSKSYGSCALHFSSMRSIYLWSFSLIPLAIQELQSGHKNPDARTHARTLTAMSRSPQAGSTKNLKQHCFFHLDLSLQCWTNLVLDFGSFPLPWVTYFDKHSQNICRVVSWTLEKGETFSIKYNLLWYNTRSWWSAIARSPEKHCFNMLWNHFLMQHSQSKTCQF